MAKSNARTTNLTGKSVDDYIDSLDSEQVRDDCRTIASIMEKATQFGGVHREYQLCALGILRTRRRQKTLKVSWAMPAIPPV